MDPIRHFPQLHQLEVVLEGVLWVVELVAVVVAEAAMVG
jgi:hypothetical protein